MLRIGFFVSDCVPPVFRDLNFNCELEQKTNMKEIFTDGVADIILTHGLVLIDFFHLEQENGPKHQPVPFLRLTLPVNGLLDLYDTSKSVYDHLFEIGVFRTQPNQPDETKKVAAPAVEKKAEAKSAAKKAAPAKKTEAKPAAKKAAPAKKAETKPAAKPAPAPAKKAETKPAAKPAPAPAKKVETKPAAKPAPAKKAEAKPAVKPAPAKKVEAKPAAKAPAPAAKKAAPASAKKPAVKAKKSAK